MLPLSTWLRTDESSGAWQTSEFSDVCKKIVKECPHQPPCHTDHVTHTIIQNTKSKLNPRTTMRTLGTQSISSRQKGSQNLYFSNAKSKTGSACRDRESFSFSQFIIIYYLSSRVAEIHLIGHLRQSEKNIWVS